MDTSDKFAAGVVTACIVLLMVAGIAGVLFNVGQTNDSPINQTVNESEVPSQVTDSKPGAVALKQSFTTEYDYQNNVSIKNDGNLVLSYSSNAQNGNQLKSEMKQVALLYADVAAEQPEIGSLTIHSSGVILTVPSSSAQAHGNGDIDEEAFFETVRWDGVDS